MMGGSAQDCWAFAWEEPWTPPALEDLLPQLSLEEQLRLQNRLREHHRVLKWLNKDKDSPPRLYSSLRSEWRRDFFIIGQVRCALHHYNAKHPGEEFDAVKPLVQARVSFRGSVWFHVNFWARCRKSKTIKRFFAEVCYKLPISSSSVCSNLPLRVPGAEKPASKSSSVCSNLPLRVPGAEKPASSSSSDLPRLPSPFPIRPIVACSIIEEPLGRYRKSCAFCRGHLDILHPMGLKFVCGNDKYRMEQRLLPCASIGLEMPFTCDPDPRISERS